MLMYKKDKELACAINEWIQKRKLGPLKKGDKVKIVAIQVPLSENVSRSYARVTIFVNGLEKFSEDIPLQGELILKETILKGVRLRSKNPGYLFPQWQKVFSKFCDIFSAPRNPKETFQ